MRFRVMGYLEQVAPRNFGNAEQVDDLQYTRCIEYEHKQEPPILASPCRVPQCEPFPKHRPNNEQQDPWS